MLHVSSSFLLTVPSLLHYQVTGFSVGGRVIDDKGVGVDEVKIIVDGQLKTTTDMQGFYKLDQVKFMPTS